MVKIDPETGEISVFREYEVVAGNEEVTDPELQKTVAEANEIEEGGVGSRVRIAENVTQQQLGRIAAQTAGRSTASASARRSVTSCTTSTSAAKAKS